MQNSYVRIRNGTLTVSALGQTKNSSVSNNNLVNIANRVRISGKINNADSQSITAYFTDESSSSRAAVNMTVRFNQTLGFSGNARISGYGWWAARAVCWGSMSMRATRICSWIKT